MLHCTVANLIFTNGFLPTIIVLLQIIRSARDNRSAGVSELADETDSKSVVREGVWVRVPPPARESGNPSGFPLFSCTFHKLHTSEISMHFFLYLCRLRSVFSCFLLNLFLLTLRFIWLCVFHRSLPRCGLPSGSPPYPTFLSCLCRLLVSPLPPSSPNSSAVRSVLSGAWVVMTASERRVGAPGFRVHGWGRSRP